MYEKNKSIFHSDVDDVAYETKSEIVSVIYPELDDEDVQYEVNFCHSNKFTSFFKFEFIVK
jgi:hypothetical protein